MTETAKADLLYGLKAIASYLDWPEGRTKHRVDAGELPTFRVGGTICSTRAKLDAWIVSLAERRHAG